MTEEAPEPVVRKKAPSRQVCIYDAESGTRRNTTVRRDGFNSEEEFTAYIKQVQANQREKNRQYRLACKRKRIETVLAGEPAALEVAVAVPQSPVIDINLSPGTGNTVVLYGSSKRGKTTLMMHLYDKYYANDKKFISTLFSGNPQQREYRGNKDLIVAHGFTPRSVKYIKMQYVINVDTKNRYKFLVMFDDIIDQKAAPIMNKLVLTYRNSNISSMICLQYVKLLAKANRASVNHTCVFGANTAEDEEAIIKTLLKPYFVKMGLVTLNEQIAFYRRVTADHGFIYIDNVQNLISYHRLTL